MSHICQQEKKKKNEEDSESSGKIKKEVSRDVSTMKSPLQWARRLMSATVPAPPPATLDTSWTWLLRRLSVLG